MQTSFLSHADAAVRNRNHILHFVRDHGPISRTDIWEQMNISRASVTQVIKQLEDNNLIIEVGEGESTGGRKPRFISFNGDAKKMFAFDWSSQTLALITLGGAILFEVQMYFQSGISPVAFAADLTGQIEQIRKLSLTSNEDIIGFGLALPGLIDSKNSTVLYSVELGWQNVNLNDLFSENITERIYLERTGNIMAIGEHTFGQSRDVSHFQLFILSQNGIGVSTIIHNDCQHGANFIHGELGHIKMPVDTICSCGQRGCLEAVVNHCMIQSGGEITDQILEYLSIGVSTAVNISDPGAIMLIGSYIDQMQESQKTLLKEKIRAKLTGRNLRRLDIGFSNQVKELSLKGLSAFGFDCYFAVG